MEQQLIHILDEGLVHSTQNEFGNNVSSRAINKEESSHNYGSQTVVSKSSHATNATGITISAGVNGSH